MRAAHLHPPTETGTHDGLAYGLFAPAHEPLGAGVVILHGADSCKESHYDFARACAGGGLMALAFDARGHGESAGALDDRAIADVAAMADLVRERLGDPLAPVGLRGSSMGGYLAIVSSAAARARATVAICPASAGMLARGLAQGRFDFRADAAGLAGLLGRHDAIELARGIGERLLLLHAEGDEQVPIDHSRRLHHAARGSRLIAMPGGHHRSVQHDPDLQAVAVRFLSARLRA